jgi:hypothetical protein
MALDNLPSPRIEHLAPEWPDVAIRPTRIWTDGNQQSHTTPFAFRARTRVGHRLYQTAGDTYDHARWELEQMVGKDLA